MEKVSPQPFSKKLQSKIDKLSLNKKITKLGRVEFSSPFIFAPLSGVSLIPYRSLMQDLGAGGSISELVSIHGINHDNEKTRDMLNISPDEMCVGLQLFGDDPIAFSKAVKVAETYNPKFIDINVGCPTKKVTNKGAGSALLKNLPLLTDIIKSTKENTSLPLSIKIRTGFNLKNIVAKEVVNIAYNEGVEFVTIHGRTKEQLYGGVADWELIENVASASKIPVIGNGDLKDSKIINSREESSNCSALMIGRGALKDPFIFLKSASKEEITFNEGDSLEVLERFYFYLKIFSKRERQIDLHLKKHAVWMTHGCIGASSFRSEIFSKKNHQSTIEFIRSFFS